MAGVFAMVVVIFLFGDNVVAPDFTGDPSFTNQGWDAVCDGIGGMRTASGDCIPTK